MNFSDTKPTDLAWLEQQQVIDMIFNTFDSRIIDEDKDWVAIESRWHLLGDGNLVPFTKEVLLNKTFNVYFYLTKRDYLIIRGNDHVTIEKYVSEVCNKNAFIIDDKHGNYVNGNSFSTILKGREFSNILFSLVPLSKNEEFTHIAGKYYSLESFLCSDPTISDSNFAYFSDLLIGTSIYMKNK